MQKDNSKYDVNSSYLSHNSKYEKDERVKKENYTPS